MPSEKYAAVGAGIATEADRVPPEGAGRHEERTLTAGAWNEIESWLSAGDAGLPVVVDRLLKALVTERR